ncbi:hypothetical protein [uncultured Rubinisphaera sp.]|uniref:hypothetical protein n=1 Tax=uncultured Rubinisphaera sp. TaxID=1678686 RepID=UPI0030D9AAF6
MICSTKPSGNLFSDPDDIDRKDKKLDELHTILLLKARRRLLLHLLDNHTGTINDIEHHLKIPDDLKSKVLSKVAFVLVRRKLIRKKTCSSNSSGNNRTSKVSVWEIVNYRRAELWLIRNPIPEMEGNS